MPPSLDWDISHLSPLIGLLSKLVTTQAEIIALAERAGSTAPEDIPKRDKASVQWQEVIKDAITEGYLEQLIQEGQARAKGKSGEIFRRRLQEVGARRLVSLLGHDYDKLKGCISALFEAMEPKDQPLAVADLRRTVLSLQKALDDIPWQALTPVETSAEEIQKRREVLVVLCVNIIGHSEYLLTLIKPLSSPETPADPQGARTHLATQKRELGSAADDDEKKRQAIDERMNLALEARKLWYALKENVTLPPDGQAE